MASAPAAMPTARPPRGSLAAEMTSISKSFFGVNALADVDFDLRWGEVHALLGENGAGKTSLCSVLAGLYRPDDGQVSVDGKSASFNSPRDALAAGVGMVYQEFRLVERFTVAENVSLGDPTAAFRLRRRRLERYVGELGASFGIDVDPGARVAHLSVGERQRVEILKLLHRDVRCPHPRRAHVGADPTRGGRVVRHAAPDGEPWAGRSCSSRTSSGRYRACPTGSPSFVTAGAWDRSTRRRPTATGSPG